MAGKPCSVRMRNGQCARVYRLPSDHWVWAFPNPLGLRGHTPSASSGTQGKSEIHQWRLDGRWRLSGKDHPLDLILDTKTNEIT